MGNETAEIEVVQESALQTLDLGMLHGVTVEEMIASATAIATPLKQFIKDRGLCIHLGGDVPHVFATAWSTMVAMLGVFPQEISVIPTPVGIDGWGSLYTAKVALVRISDQVIVCQGSAECGGEGERDWHFRPKYDYSGPKNNRVRNCVGEAPVPGNQRRSMALTRATGKASRMGFGWIMEMAGYSPTPAEEMPQPDEDPQAAPPKEGRDPLDRPPKSQATEPRMVKATSDGICKICKGGFSEGVEIAIFKEANGKAHRAHWDPCYLDTQNAKEK